MNSKMIIEIVGYIGSLLVLISFLMTSVVKLRVVNTVGSIIFTIYALIIRSYPTAIMNFVLILVNIWFLLKMRNPNKEYALIKADADDSYLRYLLGYYREDIDKCFPGIAYDLKAEDTAYIVSHEGKAVGITLTVRNGDEAEFLLDYTIPEYRDFSIGAYLLEKLKEEGIKKIIYKGPTDNHLPYLTNMGFIKEEDQYVKAL
ncbi:MAG: YgjV family protein [Erysipelotrichaceae bacterium]|nr:YgjV family protein [Erysipelotrichaceae bacterium]